MPFAPIAAPATPAAHRRAGGGARLGAALALAVCLALALVPAPAAAGGYGGLDWGESIRGAQKKLKEAAPRPRTDVEALALEARVLTDERDEKVRLAILKKRPRADIVRLRRAPPAKARLAALGYWVDLGPLDGKVILSFFDDRLYAAEVTVIVPSALRASAGELLDLLVEKYGPPREHRGEEKAGAPAVDVFVQGDTRIEAFQQPATAGRNGLVQLVYLAPERQKLADAYVEDLHARAEMIATARHPQGPTEEEREAARKAALLRHL